MNTRERRQQRHSAAGARYCSGSVAMNIFVMRRAEWSGSHVLSIKKKKKSGGC